MTIAAGGVKLSLVDSIDYEAWADATLVHAIAEVTRSVTRTTPAPRGMPFFGLDMDIHEPQLLDDFCRHGIFRKYERGLIVDCGFGGAARWWAMRWGCTVIGTTGSPNTAHGATVLSRRAALYGSTTFVAAPPTVIPLRPECVTHAWIRDLQSSSDAELRVKQAFGALRPGGHLTADTVSAEMVSELKEVARGIGFIAVETHPLRPAAAPQAFLTALNRLDSVIAQMSETMLRRALSEVLRRQRQAALEPPPRLQLFAQRPS